MRPHERWTIPALMAFAACGQPSSSPPPRPVTVVGDGVVRVDTVRVATTAAVSPELEDRVARLQIQLFERDVLIQELEEQLATTRLELVRNMARLQTQASRAEAASGMAEADVAISTLRRAPGASDLPELAQADDLFRESTAEFAGENYGGALYLATQVRALVRAGQTRLRSRGEGALVAGETVFAVPVPLNTTGRANVRSGPGTNFAVAFTLEASTPVTGQSYTSQWVRVVDAQNRQGWIFSNLVTNRQ